MTEAALPRTPQATTVPMRIAWLFGAVAFLLQVAFGGRYGYFRDELYYIACSNHPAFGYVDMAPLTPWLTRASHYLFGDSLHAIRLLPALGFAINVALTGYIARELGGKRWAMGMACVTVMLAPVILGNGTRLAMNSLEPCFWMGCVYVLLLAINRQQPKLLLWCGVLLGFGLLNKHSTIFFLGALVAGLLLTPQRKLFTTKWFWVATAMAFFVCLPNVIWQYTHHFPTLEDLRNVKAMHKNIELSPLPFIKQQIMMLNPITDLVWIAGLAFLLLHRSTKPFRFLGCTYLFFLGVMMALHGKDYYLAPIYSMLFAAGGVFWETLSESRSRLRWVRVALPCVVVAVCLISIPLALPVLPPEKIAPYMRALGIANTRTETTMTGMLPQHFADQFGWEEMVASVARVYTSFPPEQRAKTAILAGNYGEAGAIDFFGPRYLLPKAISAHQNYYYWGPRDYTGESIILLGWELKDAQRWCRSVDVGPRNAPYYGMGWEYYDILVCHDFKMPLSQAWPKLKMWN